MKIRRGATLRLRPACSLGAVLMKRRFWLLLSVIFAVSASAQNDIPRETVAITYPLDRTVTVRFRGTTRLPRLSGEAKIKRTGRRGTRIEMKIEHLPRAYELGGAYTTYVLWAITPEGRTDNLGEIKRSGSFLIDSKIDVTTPLQTFALIVTAEPHFLVQTPSRMVVLENLPPRDPGEVEIATVPVRYIGNTSDYYRELTIPEVADSDYTQTPTSLLGARQAVKLARFAGAEREAPEELKAAEEQLQQAESAWRLKQKDAEVDALARRATSLAVRAEELAVARRAARQRREEIARRDEAVREAERAAADASKEISQLREAVERGERTRELLERDLANANQRIRDLQAENERLREELQGARAEAERAKIELARIEGERRAEEARRAAEQRAAKRRAAMLKLKQQLARYGTVRETERGLVLILPENALWTSARATELSPRAAAKLEPLAALLANYPDFRLIIEAYSDDRGDGEALRAMTEERARALAARLVAAGLDSARIESVGMGAANPVAPNTTIAGRARNRRAELILVPETETERTSRN